MTKFTPKSRQIKILEQQLLESELIIEDCLFEAKKLYLEDVWYHNYLHALWVANYALNLRQTWLSPIEVRSLIVAWLFHDAWHNWIADLLDEFISLDLFYKTFPQIQEKNPGFIIDYEIVRHSIMWSVFKNRSKNTNLYAQILADLDIWSIWDDIASFFYYASLYALELNVEPDEYYTKSEVWYFKYLMSVNKYVIISDYVKQILPNALKNIKKYFNVSLDAKIEIFEVLLKEDITLAEFKERFKHVLF